MKIDLSGRIALVTGSADDIGFATAQDLAAAGADVVVNGRSRDKTEAAAVLIGGTAMPWLGSGALPRP